MVVFIEPTVKSPKRIHIPTFCAPIAPEKHFARRNNILESLDKAFEKNEKVALCGESGFGLVSSLTIASLTNIQANLVLIIFSLIQKDSYRRRVRLQVPRRSPGSKHLLG